MYFNVRIQVRWWSWLTRWKRGSGFKFLIHLHSLKLIVRTERKVVGWKICFSLVMECALFRGSDSGSECNVLFFYLESRLQFDFELFLCSLRSLFLVFRWALFLRPQMQCFFLGQRDLMPFEIFGGALKSYEVFRGNKVESDLFHFETDSNISSIILIFINSLCIKYKTWYEGSRS